MKYTDLKKEWLLKWYQIMTMYDKDKKEEQFLIDNKEKLSRQFIVSYIYHNRNYKKITVEHEFIDNDKIINNIKMNKIEMKGRRWNVICSKKYISWEFIKNNPDKPWNYDYVSKNPNITIEILKNNSNIPWNYKYLSENININWNFITENMDKIWNWDKLSKHPNITIDIIMKTNYWLWNWEYVSENPNLSWPDVLNNLDLSWKLSTIYRRFENYITWTFIKNNPNKNWTWHEISRNPNITFDIIKNNPDKEWHWWYVSRNPNIKWEDIINNPELQWDWSGLSLNLNITWDIIKNNLDKDWDWDCISRRDDITEEIIDKNHEIKWEYDEFISYNNNLTPNFIKKKKKSLSIPYLRNNMPVYREKWINQQRLEHIKTLQIQRHWRNCSCNPEFKLARKLLLRLHSS